MKKVAGFMQLLFWGVQWRPLKNFLIGRFAGRRRRASVSGCRHYFYAEVANLAETQTAQLRNGVRHLPKDVFDGTKAVIAGQFLQKVTQDFPILPGLTGRPDGRIQSLQAAPTIDHGAAFFCKSG
jgi:hypothetical protein